MSKNEITFSYPSVPDFKSMSEWCTDRGMKRWEDFTYDIESFYGDNDERIRYRWWIRDDDLFLLFSLRWSGYGN